MIPLLLLLAALLLTPGLPHAQTTQAETTQAETTPAGTSAGDRESLFQRAFGQRARPQRPRQLDLPVRFDGRELGLVAARLSADPTQVEVAVGAVADLLAEVAREDALAPLRALAGPDGFGRPAELPGDGVTVTVDQSDLSVAVAVPATLRKVVRLEVSERDARARGRLVLPTADISAYVNATAAVEFLARPGPDPRDGRGPVNAVFEPVVNLDGWVVEGEVQFREGAATPWTRGPTRLVKDVPAIGLRAELGDVVSPVFAMQSARSLGGLTIGRNFTLQPYRSIQPAGQRDFILEQPSLVEVQVNGRPTRTFRLEPGPYNLRNFPGASGTNDVAIRITDRFGRTETIGFPFFFDSQLLAAGIHEFAYAVGVPSRFGADGLSYDADRPTFSGFHRIGANDRLTFGAGVQADADNRSFTGEALFATGIGTFGLEPTIGRGDADGSALRLLYRTVGNGDTVLEQRTITSTLSWQSAGFQPFGGLGGTSDTLLDASIRVSQSLTENLTAAFGGRWQALRRTGDPGSVDPYGADISLRQRLGSNASFDVTVSRNRDSRGDLETGVFLAFRFTLGDGRQSGGLSYDSVARDRRLDWRFQSARPVDQLTLALDASDDSDGGARLQGSASYLHRRFLATLDQDTVEAIDTEAGGGRFEHRTRLTAATAVAFADGHLALSRPIANSFALVVPHPRLRDLAVGVDPINGSYLAESDLLGPPVVANISPYILRPLQLDVPDAPLGYDLGETRPVVAPGFRTGTLVPIGTDAAVSLDGILVGPDGLPAALLSGVLRPVAGDGATDPRAEIAFFTNRRGRFRLEGVRPGTWELVVSGVDVPPVSVRVERDQEGLVSLGTIQLGDT